MCAQSSNKMSLIYYILFYSWLLVNVFLILIPFILFNYRQTQKLNKFLLQKPAVYLTILLACFPSVHSVFSVLLAPANSSSSTYHIKCFFSRDGNSTDDEIYRSLLKHIGWGWSRQVSVEADRLRLKQTGLSWSWLISFEAFRSQIK